jgi:transcription antitermination factor NusG
MMHSKRPSEVQAIGPTDRHIEKIDRARANHAMVRRQLEAAAVEGDRAWYAIRVRVNCEKAVDKALVDAGIGTWLALEKVEGQCRRGRMLPATYKPVLWGLVFVHVAMSADAWHGLMSIKHVLSVLGDEHGAKPVLEKQFNSFRTMVTMGVYGDKPKGWKPGVGDTVCVGSGAAFGKTGTVNAIKGRRRDRIMLTLWGGSLPIEVPLALLVKPE